MAQYPSEIYTPRTMANRPGAVYDVLKTKVIFAEDFNKDRDEIVAIETELGVNPKGAYDDVSARLDSLGAPPPVKATGAEINTGTDDAKFATPKAIADSNLAFLSDIPSVPVKATGAEIDAGSDDAKFATPKALADQTVLLKKSGGILTGEVDLGENAGLVLDAALSADGKYSGITEAGTAGATLVFGDLCYFQAADSRWEKVDANLSAGYNKKLGICVLAAANDGSATKMLLFGKIRADAAFPTLTIGSPVYMSETDGAIVVAQPTTPDVCIRVIGYGNTGDELFFNPSSDYITHI